MEKPIETLAKALSEKIKCIFRSSCCIREVKVSEPKKKYHNKHIDDKST